MTWRHVSASDGSVSARQQVAVVILGAAMPASLIKTEPPRFRLLIPHSTSPSLASSRSCTLNSSNSVRPRCCGPRDLQSTQLPLIRQGTPLSSIRIDMLCMASMPSLLSTAAQVGPLPCSAPLPCLWWSSQHVGVRSRRQTHVHWHVCGLRRRHRHGKPLGTCHAHAHGRAGHSPSLTPAKFNVHVLAIASVHLLAAGDLGIRIDLWIGDHAIFLLMHARLKLYAHLGASTLEKSTFDIMCFRAFSMTQLIHKLVKHSAQELIVITSVLLV